jgi:hypothetical protein
MEAVTAGLQTPAWIVQEIALWQRDCIQVMPHLPHFPLDAGEFLVWYGPCIGEQQVAWHRH